MYRDIEIKLGLHKERIIKEFIAKGIYPDDKMINQRLNDIELRLSIFKKLIVKEGGVFDTKAINRCISDIYTDLEILYKLLYEITIERYNSLNNYVNTHLNELQEYADMYLKKAEIESNATSIGKTLLFMYKNFIVDHINDLSIIKLGQIEIEDASTIACIIEINNTELNNIIFKFEGAENTISCNAYNYNHDKVTFPGAKNNIVYEYSISENQKINGLLELPISLSQKEGSFVTLAGKDKILYKRANKNGEIIEEKPIAINSLSFKEHSYIDFYVLGGTSISFRFNKKPLATNFSLNGDKIENLDYIHHFFIECDENFSFDFELEKGTVYAFKEKTLKEKDSLFYSGNANLKSFAVIQTLPGDINVYNLTIEIYNPNILNDDIKSVLIKKIQ